MYNRQPNEFQDYSNAQSSIPNSSQQYAKALENKLDNMNNIVIPAIRNRIMTTQRTDNEYFTKKHRIVHQQFPTNSEVMIKNVNRNSKTDPRYEGPFVVHGVTKNGSYILTDKTGTLLSRDVPTSHIKLISTDNVVNNRANQQQYDVQAIIQHKGNNTSNYTVGGKMVRMFLNNSQISL
ncbi:hypothetical protein G6F21_013697 [Rhizopus arrhizus]|nr:hypothetical protein G6F21_013697 [Rhizopus arrhizus]KAG1084713.1 hypothetical protein G6F40_014409 [Rhizopus arrhizus]